MSDLIIFPTPLDAHCELVHDTGGWTLVGVPAVHSSGRPGQAFSIPTTTPNGNGCQLTITATGYVPLTQRAVLELSPLPVLETDDYRLVKTDSAPTFGPVQIVNDHFELGGKRWPWMMTTGFCDYKLFLDGGADALRPILQQNQDLGARGRRVLPHIVNIVDFNPDVYAAKGYWQRFPEYFALNAEYGQYVDFPVLSDTGYRGWSLAQCQAFWQSFTEAVRPFQNRFLSLTNEFDHGGNLVGRPDDYPRPAGMIASQGSAVQDATPPCPQAGTGAGWEIFEWHAADSPTKFDHEYYIWQGLSTGAVKPCVISEHGRRLEEGSVDLNYIRTLTYASLANGCGLTVHTGQGKVSQVVGPQVAKGIQTAMSILAGSL